MPSSTASLVDEIAFLGRELNANQYKIVRLAARYELESQWLAHGFSSAAIGIATTLDIHTSTAHEWIRVGHALGALPRIDAAFASHELSYAKARILTRWATEDNEHDLLELARERTANRLTVAVANYLSGDESDEQRNRRLHESRSVTVRTNADGMVVIRAELPPAAGKTIAAAIDEVLRQVAAAPIGAPNDELTDAPNDEPSDAPNDELTDDRSLGVTKINTEGGEKSSADDFGSMSESLSRLKREWQPSNADDGWAPSMAQQRADAFLLLFLRLDIALSTEVVLHVRADGATFDDGTPITESAVCQRLDRSFIRALVHDADRRPVNASSRRRHPTTRQKRVVLETHNHECVDCQRTDLLEIDHNPPFNQTRHTVTHELEPRCAPCHRAKHRREQT